MGRSTYSDSKSGQVPAPSEGLEDREVSTLTPASPGFLTEQAQLIFTAGPAPVSLLPATLPQLLSFGSSKGVPKLNPEVYICYRKADSPCYLSTKAR